MHTPFLYSTIPHAKFDSTLYCLQIIHIYLPWSTLGPYPDAAEQTRCTSLAAKYCQVAASLTHVHGPPRGNNPSLLPAKI